MASPDRRKEFAEVAGYELKDPFGDICSLLSEGVPFSFSRFGDGEFNAIFGRKGANCDHHKYYRDLGLRLRRIIESRPDYIMGLLPLALALHDARRIVSISPGVRWVLASSLHIAMMRGRVGEFFDALDRREVLVVGPNHLGEFSQRLGWAHLPVRSRNCWIGYEETLDALRDSIPDSDGVVLFCASMMSNVLIDDLYTVSPCNTYVDIGSVFDPYAGIKSRAYHKNLDFESLNRSVGQA